MGECSGCGGEIRLMLPIDRRARALARKIAPLVMCDECAERLDQVDERKLQARLMDERFADSDIPAIWRDAQWHQLYPEHDRLPVIAAARRWVELGGSMFVFGGPGRGKSRLAATAAGALLERQPLHWVNAPVLFTRAEADFDTEYRKHAERVLLSRIPLFLDDLGKEAATQRVGQWLMAALEMRIQAGAHLFVTSNFQPSELGAKHGDWLASRLGAMVQWHLPGPDWRIHEPA